MRKNTTKEYIEFAVAVSIMVVMIIGSNIINDEKEAAIAINFIFGLPLFFIIFAFVRGLKKSPTSVTIEGKWIIITFFGHRKDEVMLNALDCVTVHIHSQRTAFLEIKYDDLSGHSKTIKCWKKYHRNFTEFSQVLLSRVDDEKVWICSGDENGKVREIYNLDVPWMEFLENERNLGSLFDELKKESLLKKLGTLVWFSILIILRAGAPSKTEFMILGWFFGIGYIIYLLVGAILRVRGYSREESIGLFLSGSFFVFFGFGSVCMIVITLLEHN